MINIDYLRSGNYLRSDNYLNNITKSSVYRNTINNKLNYYRLASGFKDANNSFINSGAIIKNN